METHTNKLELRFLTTVKLNQIVMEIKDNIPKTNWLKKLESLHSKTSFQNEVNRVIELEKIG